MHLVGFIIRIYHDARSPERQITQLSEYHTSLKPVTQHSVLYKLSMCITCPIDIYNKKIVLIPH